MYRENLRIDAPGGGRDASDGCRVDYSYRVNISRNVAQIPCHNVFNLETDVTNVNSSVLTGGVMEGGGGPRCAFPSLTGLRATVYTRSLQWMHGEA